MIFFMVVPDPTDIVIRPHVVQHHVNSFRSLCRLVTAMRSQSIYHKIFNIEPAHVVEADLTAFQSYRNS